MALIQWILYGFVALIISINGTYAKDKIETKRDFIQKIVGKRIADPKLNTWMVAKANGQISGQFKGINIKGKWHWNDKYWCRSARIGIIFLSLECQQITLVGNTLILKRKKGTGSSHTYQLNEYRY